MLSDILGKMAVEFLYFVLKGRGGFFLQMRDIFSSFPGIAKKIITLY